MNDSIFELDPHDIKVNEKLPRVRHEVKKIEELAESFAKYGQMQPIVVNRNYELIAGGRRTAACLHAGIMAKCIFVDAVDPLKMREMELEENIQRESLTPAEEVLATKEIHELKQKLYGETTSGRAGGHTLDDTAEALGKTRGSVIDDIQLAVFVEQFPGLRNAKTKSEIRKAAKAFAKASDRIDALRDYEQTLASANGSKFDVSLNDAIEHMKGIEDGSISLLLTDPPWGIDVDKNTLGVGGVTGGVSSSGIQYKDDKESALEFYSMLGKESFRFTSPSAHAYVFCAPEHFWLIRSIWQASGWLVSPRPIIWVKGPTGQNNAPHAWPSAAYEFIMFARKIDSRLVVEGRVDWIKVDPVSPSERLHHSEKPLELLKELILRTSLPSQRLYDPFMGSGASVEAALNHKMFPIACDNAPESYAATLQRLTKWQKEQKK